MVGLVGEMFPGHFLDGHRIKNSGGGDEGGFSQVLSPLLEILLEPRGDGHGKSGFFAVKNVGRKIMFESLPEDEFGLATSHFVIGSKGEGVGYKVGIEEGNTDFEGVRHASPIDLHQDALLKVQFCAEIEDSFQTSG